MAFYLSFIRSCIFLAGYTVFTLSYGTLSVFTWLLPPLVRHKIIASWTTLIVIWLRACCGVRYELRGKEHLEKIKQPAVILSKHQSTWETFYLQSLFWPASTVLKRELLRIPFFGWGLRAMQPIAIDRSNPRNALRQVKNTGIDRIKDGLNVILFPEGTRTLPGEKRPYARSGAEIALNADVNIVPVALNATVCWPSKSFVKYPGLVTVVVGPAISPKGKSSKEIMKEVEVWIESEMETLNKTD
ncbi:MAG: 1-acyl-sn-glycerol-3-phosphate acyltransferase [Agarilytica sp.]